MRDSMRLAVVLLIVPLALASDVERSQAVRAVESTMPAGASMLLAAEEEVSLGESTITLQNTARSWRQAKVIRFFRVFPAQYQVEQNRVVAEQVHLDSDPEWWVAVVPGSVAASGHTPASGLTRTRSLPSAGRT